MSLITKMFPQELKAFIEAKGLTLEAFKQQYNFSEGTMRRMLRGEVQHLRSETYEKIATMMKDRRWAAIAPPPRIRRGPRKTVVPPVDKPEVITYVPAIEEPDFSPDFPVFVGETNYVPRDLKIFVVDYPMLMPQEDRDLFKTLLEQHLVYFKGLKAGHYTTRDSEGRYVLTEPTHAPHLAITEKTGKPVRRALERFFARYVRGRTRDEVILDGLDLIAVEMDGSDGYITEAWKLNGVVFSNTGICEMERDINNRKDSATTYVLGMVADVFQNIHVYKEALALLNERRNHSQQQE
jgi:hypothetical protein